MARLPVSASRVLQRWLKQLGRLLRSKHWFWRLSQRYMEMELVREKALDPSKQYVFGIWPHGILILSRVAVYGDPALLALRCSRGC